MIDVDLIGAPSFVVEVLGSSFVTGNMNRRMAQLLGCGLRSLAGLTPHRYLSKLVADRIVERYRLCVDTLAAVEFEEYIEFPGGNRWWHITATPILDRDTGKVVSLINVATDITGRQKADRDQREALARMSLAMEVLEGGFWHYDIGNGILDASPRLIELVTGTALAGVTWADFVASVHTDDIALVDISPMVRGQSDAGVVEYRVMTATGDVRWMRCKRKLVRDDRERPYAVIGVVVDITEDKRIRADYAQQATTDVLTKLYNRRGFEDCADLYKARIMSTGIGFGLVLIDLDRFKPINDSYGHAIGDFVLRAVARRLARETRPTDIVARIGGDEFAILVADIEEEPIARLGERIVKALAVPIDTPAGSVLTGASVGMACVASASESIEDLFARADAALYEIKRSGRGACKYAA